MSIPEYDNISKWAAFFRRLPFWLKTITVVALIAVVTIYLYSRFGPARAFQKDNARLKASLSQSQAEVAALRDKKDELHRENLHLKELIDPIQKKAELLYPELETAAAIAKLAEDVQDVRSLATRDVYKPLAEDKQQEMVAALRALQAQGSFPNLSVTVVVQQGSSSRARVASDLKKYLQDAGWNAEMKSVMSFYSGTPPDISIKMHPEDIPITQQLAGIVGTLFINRQFAGIKREKFERGHIEITINGDPLFSDSGIVTFR